MGMVRTNITLPADLLVAIDEVAGPRGRSAYVADAVRKQIRRDRLRKVLDETWAVSVGTPEWRSPEETLDWVRALRSGDRELWSDPPRDQRLSDGEQ